MNNTILFKIHDNKNKTINKVKVLDAINSDSLIKTINRPEEKLRVFLLRYKDIMLNAINISMGTTYKMK